MKAERKKKTSLKPKRLRSIPFGWILTVVVVLLNLNTLGNGFTLDDRTLIQEDPRTSDLTHIGEIFSGGYRVSPLNRLYRPLTVVSLALNHAFLGGEPSGFHVVNLALHLLVVVLVFRLSRELLKSESASFLAALFFAVHPVHVEAVANVVGRAEMMAAISVLGGLILLLRNQQKAFKDSWLSYAGVLVLFAAGLLSKESAIVLVGLWPLFNLFCRAEERLSFRLRSIVLDHRLWGLVLVALAFLWVRKTSLGIAVRFELPDVTFIENPLAFVPPQTRILTAIYVIARYVWLLIWPYKLSADYSYNVIPLIAEATSPIFLISACCVAGLGLGAVFLVRTRPIYLLSYAFVGISVSVVSNLVIPIGAIMAERFLYLPSVAFCWVLAAAIHGAGRIPEDSLLPNARSVWSLAALLIIFPWGVKTCFRNLDWKNDRTLFEAALRTTPESAKAHTIMGDICYTERSFEAAEQEYRKALDIYPQDTAAAINRAAALDALKRHKESFELLESFAGRSGHLEVGRLHELAVACMGLSLYQRAAEAYESILRLTEADALAHRNLGGLYVQVLGQREKGIVHIRRSLELAPRQPGNDQLRTILETESRATR